MSVSWGIQTNFPAQQPHTYGGVSADIEGFAYLLQVQPSAALSNTWARVNVRTLTLLHG